VLLTPTLPVPTLLDHVCTQHTIPHSGHIHTPHFHVHSGSLVSSVFVQVSLFGVTMDPDIRFTKKRRKMVVLHRKKWFSSVKMVSTAHDSIKRHCLPPLCGRESVKCRWGSVACSGCSGRGECGLFRSCYCAFALLKKP
jgi:hypothetical protein